MEEKDILDLDTAVEGITDSFKKLSDAMSEVVNGLSSSLSAFADLNRKVIIKNESVPPKKYGLYLQQKKRRRKR